MSTAKYAVLAAVLSWLTTAPTSTWAQEISAEEIVARSQEAFLAAGDDMTARITMRLINKAGRERVREMTMLRKDREGGDQRYFIFFHRSGDVRDMTFMVWKHEGQDDDRWLFVPAIQLVRRIAADDSRASFVGSDFTYEDVSGRDVAADIHEVLREETLDGTPCYVVESTPKDSRSEYQRKVSWIASASFLSLKEDYYDGRGELYRTYTADAIADVGGYPTVTQRTMTDLTK